MAKLWNLYRMPHSIDFISIVTEACLLFEKRLVSANEDFQIHCKLEKAFCESSYLKSCLHTRYKLISLILRKDWPEKQNLLYGFPDISGQVPGNPYIC